MTNNELPNYPSSIEHCVSRDVAVGVKRLFLKSAKLPERTHEDDAADDLFIAQDFRLDPFETAVLPTGLAMEIPKGYHLDIRSKSGLASKGVFVTNGPGLIDSTYRGEIGVIMTNRNDRTYKFDKGDKIAQCMIVPTYRARFIEVEELSETARNTCGFGSTGV